MKIQNWYNFFRSIRQLFESSSSLTTFFTPWFALLFFFCACIFTHMHARIRTHTSTRVWYVAHNAQTAVSKKRGKWINEGAHLDMMVIFSLYFSSHSFVWCDNNMNKERTQTYTDPPLNCPPSSSSFSPLVVSLNVCRVLLHRNLSLINYNN